MEGIIQTLHRRARKRPARVALPEAHDPRILVGARRAKDEGIALPVLVGAPAAIQSAASAANVVLADLPVVDPEHDTRRDTLIARYRQTRRSQAPSVDQARAELSDPLLFATLLLHAGHAQGLLAGARTTTGATIEPALRLRTMKPGLGPISSCFLMTRPESSASQGDLLVFADCALNPEPSAAMLAQIAIAAARAARALCNLEPRIALLSFSTLGSADHERTQKVRQALVELRKRAPELSADGELQVDAALLPQVAAGKAPGSAVAGKANVLVFPSLEAGNIAYKLVERLGGWRAIGPIFSGLNWPVNDLSRGCSVDDVVDMLAITSVMAAHEPSSG